MTPAELRAFKAELARMKKHTMIQMHMPITYWALPEDPRDYNVNDNYRLRGRR